jgi:hypothetical protein
VQITRIVLACCRSAAAKARYFRRRRVIIETTQWLGHASGSGRFQHGFQHLGWVGRGLAGGAQLMGEEASAVVCRLRRDLPSFGSSTQIMRRTDSVRRGTTSLRYRSTL